MAPFGVDTNETEVCFTEGAEGDLQELYDFVADGRRNMSTLLARRLLNG